LTSQALVVAQGSSPGSRRDRLGVAFRVYRHQHAMGRSASSPCIR